jgi:D-psicose/D-tagatose/L-ribulose 3-epimerase
MTVSLGISNIAWPAQALDEALDLVAQLGLAAVEIAPFNVFGRWEGIEDDARTLRRAIERRGLTCSALQGIVFNAPGVELFASEESRRRLARHLEAVARLAGILGARACVYGAPKQRDPGGLAPEDARGIAIDFLRSAGRSFAEQGTAIAFEANARRYGCRFVTTTQEAVELVQAVAAPGVGLQIDTGTLFLEQENPRVLTAAAPLAVHAHVSEPDLQPVGSGSTDHAPIATALKESRYRGSLSIEMRNAEDWRGAVRRAAEFVTACYL